MRWEARAALCAGLQTPHTVRPKVSLALTRTDGRSPLKETVGPHVGEARRPAPSTCGGGYRQSPLMTKAAQ